MVLCGKLNPDDSSQRDEKLQAQINILTYGRKSMLQ